MMKIGKIERRVDPVAGWRDRQAGQQCAGSLAAAGIVRALGAAYARS